MSDNIDGLVEPGFEAVRDAFAHNFEVGREGGAAFCLHVDGRKVVDLWGGWSDRAHTKSYGQDTLQLVFSTTKGATAMCANLLAQRGELDLDAPVTKYWPEFGQAGKEDVLVRWLLTHQVGLPAVDVTLTPEEAQSWDPAVEALAAQTPFWEPGTAHGYHAITYGWLVGELVRRVTGTTIGSFFASEFADPLGLEFWIGLPAEYEHRVSPVFGGGVALPTESGATPPADYAVHTPGPGPQRRRRLLGPRVDERTGLARRRGAGRQRDHQCDLTLAALRRR